MPTRMTGAAKGTVLKLLVDLGAACVVVIAGLAVTGCATLPGDPSRMTAEQLKEIVKDKSATIGCATVQTPYKGNTVFVNLDRGVLAVGAVTIGSDCTITVTNGPRAPAQ